jgi:hypothetical protein
MSRIRIAVLMVAALVVGLLVAPTAANAAKVLEVFVTNTISNPVPAQLTKPVQVEGQVSVAGDVKVTNPVTVNGPVAVTMTPGKGVVLREPLSADLVTSEEPAFYSFDTSGLSAVRFAFNSFSGSETCQVIVVSSGVTLQEWSLSGQFKTVSEVYEAPGEEFRIVVRSPDRCSSFVGAWGIPIR